MSADVELADGPPDRRPAPRGRLSSRGERARLLEQLWGVIDGAPGGARDGHPAGAAQ